MAGWLSGLAAVVVVKHLSIYVCMYVCVCVCVSVTQLAIL